MSNFIFRINRIKKMRILHAPVNCAGQAYILSRAQRRLGYKSDVLIFNQNYLDYKCDINLELANKKRINRYVVYIRNLIYCLRNYDVFHFHCGLSLLPNNLDLPILKFFGKKTIMQYWGSDIMQLDIAEKYTQWSFKELKEIYPNIDDSKQRQKIIRINSLVSQSIVGSPTLLMYSPKSIVVDKAIRLLDFPFIGVKNNNNNLTILHAPTHRKIKGTEDILKTIDRLKKEHFQFNFVLVEKKEHDEVIGYYNQADIIIDQLRQGPYGTLGTECMTLGKPVICWCNREIKNKYFLDCPVVIADRKTLYRELKKLVQNPRLRQKLAKQGRKYVEKNHDSVKIARKLIRIYQKV